MCESFKHWTTHSATQVVCQLDRKDEAPIHDLEDLALQTQLQMGDILAAVTENLQNMDRQMQADEGRGLLNDTCKVKRNCILCCLVV